MVDAYYNPFEMESDPYMIPQPVEKYASDYSANYSQPADYSTDYYSGWFGTSWHPGQYLGEASRAISDTKKAAEEGAKTLQFMIMAPIIIIMTIIVVASIVIIIKIAKKK